MFVRCLERPIQYEKEKKMDVKNSIIVALKTLVSVNWGTSSNFPDQVIKRVGKIAEFGVQ